MKKLVHGATVALGAAGLLATMAAPASAGNGAIVFVGTAHINCFGCGTSSGTAQLCANGYTDTHGPVTCPIPIPPGIPPIPPIPIPYHNVTATFTVNEPASTCPVQGTATGSTTGDVAVSFVWTRVGATAVITTSGDINGAGVAAFAAVGNPCNGPADAVVVGAVAG